MNLSIFFILIFVIIDKHQVFAKQVSLTSLLIAIYITVYMKFPKEGDKDNELAELLNKIQIPHISNLAIFEVATLVQLTFSNLF